MLVDHSQVRAFIRLGRPHFLAGGFLLHGLGVAIALYSGAALNPAALIWGQIAITSVQWMTHYGNEYFDLAADLANRTPTAWSGGSRVLVAGTIQPHVALLAAYALAGSALIAALVLALVVQTGPLTLPLILTALLLSWFYHAPPLRLHSRGLGELTIAVVVAGMTPLVGFYLQVSRLALLPLLAVLPLCTLQFAQALAIELPDREGDAAVGKRTLVVRLGRARCARTLVVAMALAYLQVPILVLLGLPPLVALAILLPLPLAAWQARRLAAGVWSCAQSWSSLAFANIALLMGTAALEAVAFLALALQG